MSKVVLGADSLDGFLTEKDQNYLARMDGLYERAMDSFKILAAGGFSSALANEEKKVVDIFNDMGHIMQEICKEAPGIKVYSFETDEQSHAEASRVIAKLRGASLAGFSTEPWPLGDAGHAQRRALVDEDVSGPETVTSVEISERGHTLIMRHEPH